MRGHFCYTSRMDNEQFWKTYVGDVSTVEFCARRRGRPIVEFVDNYVARLPHFYGIVLRGTWRETFATLPHWRRDDVSAGLIGYLEARRDEWENAVYAPEPEPPPPEQMAPVEPAPVDAPVTAAEGDSPPEQFFPMDAGISEPQGPAENPPPEVPPEPAEPLPSDAP